MKAITTKYHGATDRRGSRISASDCDANRVSIPFPHELSHDDAHRKAAQALCDKMGWKGSMIQGGIKNGEVFVFAPCLDALRDLILVLRSGRMARNPYCQPEFKRACESIQNATGENIRETPLQP